MGDSDFTRSVRRVALCWAVVLSGGQWACGAPAEDEADDAAGDDEVANEVDDALWIGATSTGETEGSFVLTPIARRGADGWRVAWPEPVSSAFEVAVDSAGRVDPMAVMATLPVDLGSPQSPRIVAPHRWVHFGSLRELSSLRVLELDQSMLWEAASEELRTDSANVRVAVAAPVTALTLHPAYCGRMWRLQFKVPTGMTGLETTIGRRHHGVSLSHEPDRVLREADIPELEEIAARLGFERRTGSRVGSRYRDFFWIGLFRFGDTVLGVVDRQGYEGASWEVVELDGENSRIVASLYQGGC